MIKPLKRKAAPKKEIKCHSITKFINVPKNKFASADDVTIMSNKKAKKKKEAVPFAKSRPELETMLLIVPPPK